MWFAYKYTFYETHLTDNIFTMYNRALRRWIHQYNNERLPWKV
jgi:hypothetical protein